MVPQESSGDESPRSSDTEASNKERKKKGRKAVVDSLGEALAGIKMGSPSTSNAANYGSSAVSSASASTPFALPKDQDSGWGNFTDAAQAAFPASATSGASDGATSGGLEQFLSQSPSQSLGEDLFKCLSHPNLRALGHEHELAQQADAASTSSFGMSAQKLAPGPAGGGSFGETQQGGPAASKDQGTRGSPTCSVTGTTASSGSVSPYTSSSVGEIGSVSNPNSNNNGRTIQAYTASSNHSADGILGRNQSSFAEDDRSSSGYSLSHGYASHPNITTLESARRSTYHKDNKNHNFVGSGGGSPYEQQGLDGSLAQQSDTMLPPAGQQATPQPQVLYMPVPSLDGRGQVLQPVQIMQLPGKPNHYVVPAPTAGAPHGDASQPLMVLPQLHNQNGGVIDYQSPLTGSSQDSGGRTPMENRNRIANYAMDTSMGRQYSLDTTTTTSPIASRDEYGLSSTSGQYIDPAVSSLYAAPERPPLDALLGQVRRLSRDQVGCRLVQQALDEEGPTAATLILNEGLPFWGEAMVDPFGNYLFQKILEKVNVEERVMLVKSVSTRLVNASLNLHGTRSVQKIVELCSQDEQSDHNEGLEETAADILTASLTPAAARLCIDSHGNHVIQRILLKLGPKHSKFVFDAVAASVGDVARHRHGCCVIQRCLDSPPSEARAHLVHRIVDKALELMQDAYGNYVVQYVLDVCSDEDVHAVCESVVGKVNLLAIQKFSSNVMEKCLERCSDRVKELYLQEMSDPERIRELMMDPFGNYVVQRALAVATHAQAVRLVEAMRPHLIAAQTSGPHGQRNGGVRNTAGGRRIIAKICRRFPNFSLTAGSEDELYNSNKNPRHQQQHHHHHLLPQPLPHQAPVIAPYAPMGATPAPAPHAAQHHHPYPGDSLRLSSHGQIPQQQSYYNVGGSGPYYEQHHFNNGSSSGHGGFPGM